MRFGRTDRAVIRLCDECVCGVGGLAIVPERSGSADGDCKISVVRWRCRFGRAVSFREKIDSDISVEKSMASLAII